MICTITPETPARGHEDMPVLLPTMLQTAVPLWAEQFAHRPFAELQDMLPDIGNIIAHKGDIILYKSNKPGETAEAFNALAKGVAIASFVPGGVCCFGYRFVSIHPELGYNKQVSPLQEEDDEDEPLG